MHSAQRVHNGRVLLKQQLAAEGHRCSEQQDEARPPPLHGLIPDPVPTMSNRIRPADAGSVAATAISVNPNSVPVHTAIMVRRPIPSNRRVLLGQHGLS